MIDSSSNGPAAGPSPLPAKSQQQVKADHKPTISPDSATQLPETPVDFHGDSTHITPRSTADTTKH
jgi:hypothetical protein